jgi:molybdopterin-guanine dinucleotide biosynthesis protein
VPAHHLVTHGVVVGMTGSGKTGLITVMVEELRHHTCIDRHHTCIELKGPP